MFCRHDWIPIRAYLTLTLADGRRRITHMAHGRSCCLCQTDEIPDYTPVHQDLILFDYTIEKKRLRGYV